MDIETAANPAGVEDTRAPEAASIDATQGATAPAGGETDEVSTENDEGLQDLVDQAPVDPEELEIDFKGAKYKIPAALKDAVLMQEDYTRKTMTVAEERRAVEAEKAQTERLRSMTIAEFQTQSQLEAAQQAVAQYQQWSELAWSDLRATDEDAFNHHRTQYEAAFKAIPALSDRLKVHFSAKEAEEQQETAKFRAAVEAQMTQAFKDWPTRKPELVAFAKDFDVSEDDFANATPGQIKLVNLARIGAQTIERAKKAESQKAAQAIQPAPEVKGKTATTDPLSDKASAEEWVRARNAQLAKRA